jgi:hypothetical protein
MTNYDAGANCEEEWRQSGCMSSGSTISRMVSRLSARSTTSSFSFPDPDVREPFAAHVG